MNCKACDSNEFKKKFLREGLWMGTKKRPLEFFRKEEFSLGWDYYPKMDLLQLTCIDCGYVQYSKVEA